MDPLLSRELDSASCSAQKCEGGDGSGRRRIKSARKKDRKGQRRREISLRLGAGGQSTVFAVVEVVCGAPEMQGKRAVGCAP